MADREPSAYAPSNGGTNGVGRAGEDGSEEVEEVAVALLDAANASATHIVGRLVVAGWLHWCGAATPGDPTQVDNTVDGLPAPVCAGCRFEVPLHKAASEEVTLLYAREGVRMTERPQESAPWRSPAPASRAASDCAALA